MKLKNILTFIIFMLLFFIVKGQEGDYLKMRDKLIVLGCGNFDTGTLLTSHRKLVKVDTNAITENRNQYFKDLAWSYYKLAGHLKDSMMMENSIYNFRRAFQMDKKDFMSLWNLCNSLSLNKHCEEVKRLVAVLNSIIPRKNKKDLDTKDLLKSCTYKSWWFKY